MSTTNDSNHPDPAIMALIDAAVLGDATAVNTLLAAALRGDDDALDGLAVVAYRTRGQRSGADSEEIDLPPFTGEEPPLSEAHEQALDALGDDFIERLLESSGLHRTSRPRKVQRSGRRPVAGSLMRTEGDGTLTDKAIEEMERKVRELEAADEEQRGGSGASIPLGRSAKRKGRELDAPDEKSTQH